MGKQKFIRVRGRIVPLREKKPSNPVGKGAAQIAAGLGIAGASGAHAASLFKEAARITNEGRDLGKSVRQSIRDAKKMGPLFEQAAQKEHIRAGHEALKKVASARSRFAAAINIRNAGFKAGSALVAAGTYTALGNTKLNKKEKAGVAGAAGVATHFAIRSSYLKGMHGKGMKWSQALGMAAKKIILKRFGN